MTEVVNQFHGIISSCTLVSSSLILLHTPGLILEGLVSSNLNTFNWKSQHLKRSSLEIDQETVPCLLVNVLVSPQPINSHVVLSSIYSLSLSILLFVCSSAPLALLGSSKVSTNWPQQGWWRLWPLQILRRVEGGRICASVSTMTPAFCLFRYGWWS